MGRSILAVIAGYVVMAIAIAVIFTLVYIAMGADGAFKPGTYEVTGTWIAVSFVVGLLAAAAGGYVCAVIAKTMGAPRFLTGLVLVLGLAQAGWIATHPKPDPGPRAGGVSNFEAMQKARTPTWIAVLTALIGGAGTFAGARLKLKD